MKGFAHLTRISLGLVSLTCVILLFLDSIGMIPDQTDRAAVERVGVAEAMVTQATVSATLDDMRGLRSILEMSVRRNDDLASVGIRDSRRRVLMATRDHERHWAGAPKEGSSASHMRMPIFHEGSRWATLEISFASSTPATVVLQILQRPSSKIVASMAVLGFFANLFFMKRVLKHLDPSQVIPTRVQTALDVMADGVLLLDTHERIVLANSAFCDTLNRSSASLVGMSASSIDWIVGDGSVANQELPWVDAIERGEVRENVPISVATGDGSQAIEFRASGSPVLDSWQRAKGAIVTFKDVTELENHRRSLETALAELEKSRDEIRLQNDELELLATTDSLTGLANRRAFMSLCKKGFRVAHERDEPLSCLMVDIDFFKKVNDDHGHAVGDEVIARVAQALKSNIRPTDTAGRYGGEEFCIVLPGLDADYALEVAERIRGVVAAPGFARIPVTVSIGVSTTAFGASSASALIDEADQGLYRSKENGRNRVTRFDQSDS